MFACTRAIWKFTQFAKKTTKKLRIDIEHGVNSNKRTKKTMNTQKKNTHTLSLLYSHVRAPRK